MVQACHACLEAGFAFPAPHSAVFLVLVAVKDEQELENIKKSLELHGIQSKMFYEPDDNMGYSAIATEPLTEDKRKFFRKYELWKPETALGRHNYIKQ
jgi:hypothetical protein